MRAMLSMALLLLVPVARADEDADQKAKPKAEGKAPPDTGLHPRVKMETTLGDIILELDGQKAPITVQNFMQYAQDGFYNGTIFHRVISNFMIQGGGFTEEMVQKTEGLRPGIKNEWKNGLKNVTGAIAMARMGQRPDSATAQFFINVKDNGALDQPRDGAAYAVFGKVVEGMDVVNTIKDVEVKLHPKNPRAGKTAPVEPIIINSVTAISTYDAEGVAARVEALEKERKEAQAKARAAQEKLLQDVVKKAEDETGKKFAKTDSGLMYVILKEGDGPTPKPTDRVEVHYTGWLLDGTKFDSSVDRGKPTEFALNRVIKGWTEGVGMMKVGEKRKLIIPSDMAYGARGRPGIPPNSDLVFDVELLAIK